MTKLFDDAGKLALTEAIKKVELRSSVEVVIAMRPSADAYRIADVLIGVAVALGALAFMLFASQPFGTLALFVDPLLAGIVAGLLSAYAPYLKHLLVGRARQRAAVRRAAIVTFVERGVHRTQGRTGVLVFLSLLEGMVELVLDTGVELHLDETERVALQSALEAAMPHRGAALAKALEALGDLLETRLPRLADDVNELPDEVC